jgi:hypothetical protein
VLGGCRDRPVAELLPSGARQPQRGLVDCRDEGGQFGDLIVGGCVKRFATFGH